MLIGLLLLIWLAVQTTPVQNWLVRQVTSKLSKDLRTTISIRSVDFDLFNKMKLEGTLIKDLHKDTLLYAGALTVNITDWFFLKDKIELKYLGLQNAQIHINRTDSVWNYQFLVDYFGGGQKSSGGKPITLELKLIEMDNIQLVQADRWRGETLSLQIGSFSADAKTFDLAGKKIWFNSVEFDRPQFAITSYDGKRPAQPAKAPVARQTIVNDPSKLRWNPEDWDIGIDRVILQNGLFSTDNLALDRAPYEYFDGAHIQFTKINAEFDQVRFQKDSITMKAKLSTRERSGLQVKHLIGNLRFHPEAMEFSNLDLETNSSRLHHYFALRYDSFNDLSDFISKVRMEGEFDGSELTSSDIAFFAPALKNWNKTISINGRISGSVDNLSAKRLEIKAGNNTYLNGDIKLAGLPDIEKTFIDFEANSFRTTYQDAVTLIPQLKGIKQPRLDMMQFLRFRGNFTGFISDFVAYGTFETGLGTLISDVNMKLPSKGRPRYSGTLETNDFNLGSFINVPQLGTISFAGKVNGSSFAVNQISAELKGEIRQLDAYGYSYKNISIDGTVQKNLFNGDIISRDPNLDMQLKGLVDLSKKVPEFDFEATVGKANFKEIKLAKDNVEFAGKINFDFTGSNIDNFLGTARISGATLMHNGTQLPFDSLYVESKMVDSNKAITVMSNEFDAALVGEFSIQDLPSAFTTFLNKYYPSYFKQTKGGLTNENFSFVITTKNVSPYLSLITNEWRGFDYSTITGRINSKENLLDLNAEVPGFVFRNIDVRNLAIKSSGDLDSLILQATIADVFISDSLHFPGTSINVSARNDLSRVKVTTSASQTLNAANISADLYTSANNTRIVFNESGFDINGKSWSISKNGELTFGKNIISAENLRIYNGQQEILVTARPSDIGNTNDVQVELKKINIGDFAPFFVTTNRFEGLLSGTVDIIDPLGKLGVDMKGETDYFWIDNDSIGKLQLSANYNKQTGKVNFTGLSENTHYNFDLQGIYNILDSTSDKQLDIATNFNDTRIDLLEKYLGSIFGEVSGYATGKLRIVGPPKNLKYLGEVKLNEGRLKVNYTNVTYTIPTANIKFLEDRIDFGNFTLKDTFQNSGTLTRGVLKHQGFNNMEFDFAMHTGKLLVLNTAGTNGEPFFGKVISRVNMTLKGPMEDMLMDIQGLPSDSSNLSVRTSSSRESGQADFIVWKEYGREMQRERRPDESKLTVRLDVTANDLLQMNVIIDEITGDIITATGEGNLKIYSSTDGDFAITGQYDIERGNYNFNFQQLLRKPFKLRENAGSYIRWSGDPYDADIKIIAQYEADNVKFSDLGSEALSVQSGSSVDNLKKFRGKVLVVATLTGKLMQPNIAFQLELPQGSPIKNDPLADYVLQKIQSDENELNKQVAFLIIFNSFGPLSSSSQGSSVGNLAVEGIVVNSISSYLSSALGKQFSNIFQNLFNDKSIKVNFNAQFYSASYMLDNASSSSFAIDRTNLDLSLAKSIFNERLTFTLGSSVDFGISSDQIKTSNFQFLPDISAEYKIRPDGRVVLTFFYRDTYDVYTASGKQNRSGASISYRRNFDRIGELFHSDKKKKQKPKMAAPQIATDSTGTH